MRTRLVNIAASTEAGYTNTYAMLAAEKMKRPLVYCAQIVSGLLIFSLISLNGCASSAPSGSGTERASISIGAPTFQMLATKGESLYRSSCSSCHGTNGAGNVQFSAPALWGPSATLGTYEGVGFFDNAEDMLNRFMQAMMPLSAKGSLSHDQYADVLSYILVQDNQVPPSATYNESQLASIKLK